MSLVTDEAVMAQIERVATSRVSAAAGTRG